MTGSSVLNAPPHRLRVAEAAAGTRVSRQWLYKNRVARGIPAYRIGTLLIFDREELDLWLEGHREEPAGISPAGSSRITTCVPTGRTSAPGEVMHCWPRSRGPALLAVAWGLE